MGCAGDSGVAVINGKIRDFPPPQYNDINVDLNIYNPKPFQNIIIELCKEYFIVFSGISFCGSFYIYYHFTDFLKSAFDMKNYFSNDLSKNPSQVPNEFIKDKNKNI